MNSVYLSAGSNIGDRKANLESAVAALAEAGRVVHVSSLYETEPVGYADQPWFLNLALNLETILDPRALLRVCLDIETRQGRVRPFPNAPRTLDLDILFFGNQVIDEPDLIIPHPRLENRRFVLEPLAEIAPELVHPLLKRSILELRERCSDNSEIHPVPAVAP